MENWKRHTYEQYRRRAASIARRYGIDDTDEKSILCIVAGIADTETAWDMTELIKEEIKANA